MGRLAAQVCEDFVDHLDDLEATRQRVEQAHSGNIIQENDVEHVYGGLVLSVFAAFEGFLDELFFGLISGDVDPPHGVILKGPVECVEVAQGALTSGKNYLEWLPYRHTMERADIFFEGGLPFRSVQDSQRSTLALFWRVRNAIAHSSRHAREEFLKVVGDQKVTQRERTPIGYLRGTYRRGPSQTRYELMVAQLKSIALIVSKGPLS